MATSADNVDGRNVRVILISKAASEGLDFKCIRQVHILDPWYNMNRIEQIIGRGVRNQSHCRLDDFKERNVEIYLHATTLSNKTVECADLYVYRYAEKKAVAIGEINRIMKTVAVDCVLNITQTHFTDERLGALAANTRIKIRTSTCEDQEGKLFKIGDRPFSEACDYMECNYECPRMKGPAIEATYHKENIKANSAQIIEKIKELYTKAESGKKEGETITVKSFHRDAIIKRLTTSTNKFGILPKINVKEIDFALTEIIENPNEIIVDNLGRTGRIVNRGKYYLFQPIELNDSGSSILESSLPVESKSKYISFETKKADIIEDDEEAIEDTEIVEKTMLKRVESVEAIPIGEYTTLLGQFSEKFQLVQNEIPNDVPAANLDWYIHINSESKQKTKTKEFMRDQFGLTNEDIEKYAVYHMMDTLSYANKVVVAKHVAETKEEPSSDLEKHIFKYFNGNLDDDKEEEEEEEKEEDEEKEEEKAKRLIFRSKTIIKILVADKNKNTLLTKDLETNVWETETPEDDSNFMTKSNEYLGKSINSFSDFFGFVGDYEKKGSHSMVFRVKRMSQKRNNTGAYLQGFVKKIVVDRLNMLIATVVKNVKANPQKYKGTAKKIFENAPKNIAITADGNVINPQFSVDKMDISQVSICGIVEMIIRKLNDEDPDGTTWFLTTEEAIWTKAELIV
jgi:hypothetical protein